LPSYSFVTAARRGNGTVFDADVHCDKGVIERIEPAIDRAADESIDANGLLLLPGVIDPQVHFREPGKEQEDLGSGSRAAKGGVTSFLRNAEHRSADGGKRRSTTNSRARRRNASLTWLYRRDRRQSRRDQPRRAGLRY
jgi:dihydroorotase-like cyclic amidohydrolase